MRAILVAAITLLAGCSSVDVDDSADPVEPSLHVFPGTYRINGAGWSLPLQDGVFDALPVQVSRLVSDHDGIEFPVGVYLPDVDAGTPVPAIVEITPYLPTSDSFDGHYQQDALEAFIAHGYAVVLVAMRGTSDAGGCMDLMGPGERSDAVQAMDWIAQQSWFDGNAAVIGLSYPGSTPWFLTEVAHPAVKTIVPISGLTDVWELLFHNGTVEFGFFVPLLYWTSSAQPGGGYGDGDARRAICPDALEGMATLAQSHVTRDRDSLGYWSMRESRTGTLQNYEGSVFLVHGLQDWNVDPHMAYPFVNELEANGVEVKHLLGQWAHAFPDRNADDTMRADWAELLLRWFDRELRGLDVDVGPMAQVQDSEMQWRSESTWPPADRVALPIDIGPAMTLDDSSAPYQSHQLVPAAATGYGCLAACPEVDPCECPLFLGPVQENPLRITGLPRVHLEITPSGPGGEVAAWLFSVGPGGTTERIGWGQIELRHAEGDGQSRAVIPGQPMTAKLQLQPMDAVVPAGHRLALGVTQGSYGDHIAGLPNYPVTLHEDGSTLILDVIERGDEAFFDAPEWVA